MSWDKVKENWETAVSMLVKDQGMSLVALKMDWMTDTPDAIKKFLNSCGKPYDEFSAIEMYNVICDAIKKRDSRFFRQKPIEKGKYQERETT